MSTDFDPYSVFLSLPPGRRPPTPEDLLGVPSGVRDRERIQQAFQERYAHVKKYILSPEAEHREAAQRILSELAQAVVRLTRLEPVVEAEAPADSLPVVVASQTHAVVVEDRAVQPRWQPSRQAVAIVAAGSIALLAIVLWSLRGDSPRKADPQARTAVAKPTSTTEVAEPEKSLADEKPPVEELKTGTTGTIAPPPDAEKPKATPKAPDEAQVPKAEPEPLPWGVWTDVLKRADPARDRLSGKCWREQDDLVLDAADGEALVVLPVRIEGSYELEIDYTNAAGFAVVFPVGTRLLSFVVDEHGASGVQLSGGQGVNSANDSRASAGRHRLVFSLRLTSTEAKIEVHWDGRPRTGMAMPEGVASIPERWQPVPPRQVAFVAMQKLSLHQVRLRRTTAAASEGDAPATTVEPPLAAGIPPPEPMPSQNAEAAPAAPPEAVKPPDEEASAEVDRKGEIARRLQDQLKALAALANRADTGTEIASFMESAQAAIDQAVAEAEFDTALKMVALAYRVAQRKAGREYRTTLQARREEIQQLAAGGAPLPRPPPRPAPPAGFVSLFDGRTLAGWQGDLQRYRVENGCLVSDMGPSRCPRGQGDIFSLKEYGDFVLKMEFRVERGANSGILIRSPRQGDLARDGMEIQILDESSSQNASARPWLRNGAISYVAPARPGCMKPTGQWNELEILCQAGRVKITLNRLVALDVDLDRFDRAADGQPHAGMRRRTGYVGFHGYCSQYRVDYRNIEIKEL